MNKNLFLAGLLFGMMFVACSSDDDDASSSGHGGDIVGVWKYGGTDVYGNGGQETYLDFMSDGTYIVIDVDELEISIGTWKRSGKKLKIALPDGEEEADYKIEDGKLYITSEKTGVVLTIVAQRVSDDVISQYLTIQKLDDFLKDKPTVNITPYQMNLNDYLITMSDYQINPNENQFQKLSSLCPNNKHPHAIDLGEAGKWACCNVGASSPEEFGGYYAWGETEEKDYYDWSTYKHCDGVGNEKWHNLGSDIAGTNYDVAHVKWGGSWKMPSLDRVKSLINNCESKGVTLFKRNKDYYYSELVGHLYEIDGKFYIIDNTDNLYVIDDKLYKIENVNNLYVIDGKLYKIEKTNKYYFRNGKVYDLSGVDLYECYIKDNYIYSVKKFDVYFFENRTTSLSEELELNKITSFSLNTYNSSSVSKGRLFTANGNFIFMPAAGGRLDDGTLDVGSKGYYWSSTQNPYYSRGAYLIGFNIYSNGGGWNDDNSFYSNGVGWGVDSRYDGLSVRPVTE